MMRGKGSKRNKSWKRRYFRLQGRAINYFADEESTEIIGTIDLMNAAGVSWFDNGSDDVLDKSEAETKFVILCEGRIWLLALVREATADRTIRQRKALKLALSGIMPSLSITAQSELLKRKFLMWQSNYFVLLSSGHLLRFNSPQLEILISWILLRVPEAISNGRVLVSEAAPDEGGGDHGKISLKFSDIIQLTLIHPEKTLVLGVDSSKAGEIPKLHKWAALLRDSMAATATDKAGSSQMPLLMEIIRKADFSRTAQARSSLLGGATPELRGQIWVGYSGALQQRRDADEGLYNHLLMVHSNHVSPHAIMVDTELLKLAGTLNISAERNASLRRILNAVAWHKSTISKAFVTPFISIGSQLLEYLEEEEVFWIVVALCEDTLPGYYTDTSSQAEVDCRVFALLAAERLPEITRHLQSIDFELWITAKIWFMELFTSFPASTVARILDVFFFEGVQVLFRIGLAVLALFESQILSASTAKEADAVFKTSMPQLVDAETLIRCAFDDPRFRDCGLGTISRLRSKFWENVGYAAGMRKTECNGRYVTVDKTAAACKNFTVAVGNLTVELRTLERPRTLKTAAPRVTHIPTKMNDSSAPYSEEVTSSTNSQLSDVYNFLMPYIERVHRSLVDATSVAVVATRHLQQQLQILTQLESRTRRGIGGEMVYDVTSPSSMGLSPVDGVEQVDPFHTKGDEGSHNPYDLLLALCTACWECAAGSWACQEMIVKLEYSSSPWSKQSASVPVSQNYVTQKSKLRRNSKSQSTSLPPNVDSQQAPLLMCIHAQGLFQQAGLQLLDRLRKLLTSHAGTKRERDAKSLVMNASSNPTSSKVGNQPASSKEAAPTPVVVGDSIHPSEMTALDVKSLSQFSHILSPEESGQAFLQKWNQLSADFGGENMISLAFLNGVGSASSNVLSEGVDITMRPFE